MRLLAPSCTLLHNLLTWKSMRWFCVPPCRISEGAMHLGTIARNLALLCLIGCATGHLAGAHSALRAHSGTSAPSSGTGLLRGGGIRAAFDHLSPVIDHPIGLMLDA